MEAKDVKEQNITVHIRFSVCCARWGACEEIVTLLPEKNPTTATLIYVFLSLVKGTDVIKKHKTLHMRYSVAESDACEVVVLSLPVAALTNFFLYSAART